MIGFVVKNILQNDETVTGLVDSGNIHVVKNPASLRGDYIIIDWSLSAPDYTGYNIRGDNAEVVLTIVSATLTDCIKIYRAARHALEHVSGTYLNCAINESKFAGLDPGYSDAVKSYFLLVQFDIQFQENLIE